MTKYQEKAQMLEANAIHDYVEAYDFGYEYGKKDAINEFVEWLEKMDYLNRIDVDYDWDEFPYETYVPLSIEDVVQEFEERNLDE